MFDPKALLDKVLGSPAGQGALGGAVASGLLTALMTKGGRKLAGSTLQMGALAAVGALAYKAWSQYQQGRTQTASAAGGGFSLERLGALAAEQGFIPRPGTGAHEDLGFLVLRAMIAAAKADGQLDAAEQALISDRLGAATLDPEEQTFLLREFTAPTDIEAVVAAAKTPELAAEVYTASVLVIDEPTPPEQAYLEELERRLGLDPNLAAGIRQSVRALPAG